jgi:hypothetical protein
MIAMMLEIPSLHIRAIAVEKIDGKVHVGVLP